MQRMHRRSSPHKAPDKCSLTSCNPLIQEGFCKLSDNIAGWCFGITRDANRSARQAAAPGDQGRISPTTSLSSWGAPRCRIADLSPDAPSSPRTSSAVGSSTFC